MITTAATMEIAVISTVKHIQTVQYIFGRMRMYNIQKDANTETVCFVLREREKRIQYTYVLRMFFPFVDASRVFTHVHYEMIYILFPRLKATDITHTHTHTKTGYIPRGTLIHQAYRNEMRQQRNWLPNRN